MPNSPNRVVSSIVLAVWGTFFWWMSIGSFYTVKLVSDLIIGNFGFPKRTPRK
ncbi:hypothetical protein P0092_01045 [Ruminiclostridium papyrosolvens DSM 2782]|uniref:hypothetical protein n=1 Tax=Ruminiclostridium papyrosolvens TaxID=29362 RepID=UPI0023E427BE|nr:hypothetical protein [Ruminiclostridium papyrosolvens]WES34596.1 hypothetical protein P0092_01045 [Ruminiclostridium papyrosolvens DSM 2782]